MIKKILILMSAHVSATYAQFPDIFELNTLNGSDGYVILGVENQSWTGWSAKSAGDFNGDGLTDLVFGADGQNSAYVKFGQNDSLSASYLVSDLVSDVGFIISNSDPNSNNMGWSVDGIGDFNGDGLGDIAIGDPHANVGGQSSVGKVFVIFGRIEGYPEGIDVVNLNGQNGFTIEGQVTPGFGRLGLSISSAGDINGDGFADLAVAAPYDDVKHPQSGSTYVIYGSDAGFSESISLDKLTVDVGFKMVGIATGMSLGYEVQALGDVNGDLISDLGISTRNGSESGSPGFAYVLYGTKNGFPLEFNINDVDGNNGFKIHGTTENQNTTILSYAGDFNGDGINDISINSSVTGQINPPDRIQYLMYGQEGGFAKDVSVNDLSGASGFRVENPDSGNIKFGRTAGSTGDINADGFDDLFLSTYSDTDSVLGYVIFGGVTGKTGVINLGDLNGNNGFTIKGTPFNSTFSYLIPVAEMRDLNGDGMNDFAIGNQFNQTNGSVTGAVYVVYGRSPDLIFKDGFE